MGRTRDQNIALANQVAHRFLGLFHRLRGEDAVTEDEIRAHEHALQLLEREALWNLYLTTRAARNLAHTQFLLGEIHAWRPYNLHAFLARAMIAPASALTGRASRYIETYLTEGVRHAANLTRNPEAFLKAWNQ